MWGLDASKAGSEKEPSRWQEAARLFRGGAGAGRVEAHGAREEQNTQKRVEGSSAQAGPPACLCVLPSERHRTQSGLSSLRNSTHIQFPGLLCFCFDPQIYDFKGFKQEGLLIRKGMTRELKVGAWAPVAWGQISLVKGWPAS